jgi:hypothetical protein
VVAGSHNRWRASGVDQVHHAPELAGGVLARQLVGSEYRYRRSGVLGLERNAQGAVPVALVLQQLSTALDGIGRRPAYGVSYDLSPKANINLPVCEVDFVMVIPDYGHDAKADVLLGECKDEGGAIDAVDVDHLRQVADALPADRFETYIVFAKLAPFIAEEIALARALNGPYQRRVILLTARELDPYHIYERAEQELGREAYVSSAEDLANVTAQLYFREAAEPG